MTTVSRPFFEFSHPFAGASHRLHRWLGSRSALTRPAGPSTVSLATQEIRGVTSFEGGLIECVEGCVWLTHDGDCRDVLLDAGQSHVADRSGRLLIYAMAASAVRLAPPAEAPRS